MNYQETINLISPILEQSGFKIMESLQNHTRYQSDVVSLTIGFNERENSFVVFTGLNDRHLTELWQKVYKEFFDIDFQTIVGFSFCEKFINFLKDEGNFILKGDLNIFEELEKYSYRSAKEYTQKLLNQQNFRRADEAWSKSNYAEFIKYINLISQEFLPKSHILKVKIASRKLNEANSNI